MIELSGKTFLLRSVHRMASYAVICWPAGVSVWCCDYEWIRQQTCVSLSLFSAFVVSLLLNFRQCNTTYLQRIINQMGVFFFFLWNNPVSLYRHRCFTGKYTTHKIHTKPHPGLEWRIFHILTSEDINDFTDIKFVS